MSVYILGKPEAPWAGYGDILIHGMTRHLPRRDGLLQLERTAPFMPPISFPGLDIVVTDAFRAQLEASGLSGLAFRPVLKSRIVNLQWEGWDRTADEPPEYPFNGEPENYILDRPHSSELAERLGHLWELSLSEHAEIEREQVGPNSWDQVIYLIESTWDGTDLFMASGVGYHYASEGAMSWLEREAGGWVAFKQAPTR